MRLTIDPLSLSQQQIESLDLRLTFDVQFLLGVDLNFNSPKVRNAMQNLNYTEEDLAQKPYAGFRLPDEEDETTEQRFLLHLHQVAHRKKMLVKERNRIKKIEAENHRQEQQMLSHCYSSAEFINTQPIEDVVTKLDKQIELSKIKRDRSQLVMRNKIREQIEDELKILNESKTMEQEKIRIHKLRRKSLQAVSARAHSFNQKTIQIARKHQQQIKEQQDKAFEKQRELLEKDLFQVEETGRESYQYKIQMKEKELKELLKQREVNERIKKLREQEMQQCDQLYKKIEEKLTKSHANRIGLYESNKTTMPLINHQNHKEEVVQKHLEAYIEKQKKHRQSSLNSQKSSSRVKKRINIRKSVHQESQIFNSKDESLSEIKIKKQQQSQDLIKDSKSRSQVNLEKIKFQQLEKVNKVLEKKRLGTILQSQIQQKKEQLREVSRSIFMQKSLCSDIQNDIVKIKSNVSKEFLTKQIQKWNCTDLIDKYLK